MKPLECLREEELLGAVMAPSGAGLDDDQRAHAAACEACAGAVLLAELMRQERDDALRDARVPAAGQVWWRAALRAHAEATRAAGRPILWLQGLAVACVLGAAAAFGGTVWTVLRGGLSWLAARGPQIQLSRVDVERMMDVFQPVLPIAIVMGICVLLMPVVLYLALSDE